MWAPWGVSEQEEMANDSVGSSALAILTGLALNIKATHTHTHTKKSEATEQSSHN